MRYIIAVLVLVVSAGLLFLWVVSDHMNQSRDLMRIEKDILGIMNDVVKANLEWGSGKKPDSDLMQFIEDTDSEIADMISKLDEMEGIKSFEKRRRNMVKLAYAVKNHGLSSFHCARAKLYSPLAEEDNMCFPYNLAGT